MPVAGAILACVIESFYVSWRVSDLIALVETLGIKAASKEVIATEHSSGDTKSTPKMHGLEVVGATFAAAVFVVLVLVPAILEHMLPSPSVSIKVINIPLQVLEIGCKTDLSISTIWGADSFVP